MHAFFDCFTQNLIVRVLNHRDTSEESGVCGEAGRVKLIFLIMLTHFRTHYTSSNTSMKSVFSSNKHFHAQHGTCRVGMRGSRVSCCRSRLCPPDVTNDGKVPSEQTEPRILQGERGRGIKWLARPHFHLFLRSCSCSLTEKTADCDIPLRPAAAAREQNEFMAFYYYPTVRPDVSSWTHYTLKVSCSHPLNSPYFLYKTHPFIRSYQTEYFF